MFKLKRATQFTLFATGLMISAMATMYIFMAAEMLNSVRAYIPEATISMFIGVPHIIIFITAAILAFTISSIIIDNVLNPLRQMISKVREVGEMNFSSPLIIDQEDDELREYAFSFNTMAAKLNRYIEMQKRFVSDASHELATPITVINGHASLLLRHAKTQDEKDSLTTIKQEALRMNTLTDSLLYLARSDNSTQTYTIEPTNINRLITECAAESRLLAPTFAIETDYQTNFATQPENDSRTSPDNSPAQTFPCDNDAIRRVLRILLSNAIKYTHNPTPKIKISATQSPQTLTVSITDNGQGIPQIHLPKIFDRFYRADPSRTGKTESSGLGLAIAQEIIHAHNGHIHAESTENQGTKITFFISA
jgi:signal transduction histidine kinase